MNPAVVFLAFFQLIPLNASKIPSQFILLDWIRALSAPLPR